MSTREDLEAALRARPDDQTLLVYADYLQSEGDPRGELIALDLRAPAMSLHSIENRRKQLVQRWLGDDLELRYDAGQGVYAGDLETTYATFDCGFVNLIVVDHDDQRVARKLITTPYLRRLSISGWTDLVQSLLALLVKQANPWLQHLSLARTGDPTPLVDGARLARATPNLEVLDLLGRNLFHRFEHAHLRNLGITGGDSLDLVGGAPLPALHTIDFAFDGDAPMAVSWFSAACVPALRRLICSRNEPGEDRLFGALGTLGVAEQLTYLELPSLRSTRDHALVQAAIARMPKLRELVFARAYMMYGELPAFHHPWARVKSPPPVPWPPRETVEDRVLVIDGFSTDLVVVVEALEEQYDELPEKIQAIWYRFWTTVDGLVEENAFNAGDLVEALTALQLSPHLESLCKHLRMRISQRRQNFFAMLRWY